MRDCCSLALLAAAVTLPRADRDDAAGGKVTLLNVSYDPTRELYRDVNAELRQGVAGAHRAATSRSSSRTAARAARRAR